VHEAEINLGKMVTSNPTELADYLSQYTFPGNIRELKNLILDCSGTCVDGLLSTTHVQRLLTHSYDYQPESAKAQQPEAPVTFGSTLPSLKEIRAALINEALIRANNNQSGAAQLIGVTRQAISKYLRE
jgi:transcriptional regulator with GAF, ATPase, and Fis domain